MIFLHLLFKQSVKSSKQITSAIRSCKIDVKKHNTFSRISRYLGSYGEVKSIFSILLSLPVFISFYGKDDHKKEDNSTKSPASINSLQANLRVVCNGNITGFFNKNISSSDITAGTHHPAARSVVKSFKQELKRSEAEDSYVMTMRSNAVTDFIRDGSKIMQMGDHMYSYGGWTAFPEESYNDVYKSDGNLSTWKRIPDAPWHGRHTFGIGIGKLNSTLYIFGGDYLNSLFDVWGSTDGENFTLIAADLQNTVGSRLLYGACSHNNKLYVLGGQANLGPDTGLPDVWSSPDGLTWTRIANNLPFLAQNISGSVASFDGKIWVIGGGYYDHPDAAVRWTNHVYSSADGITWTQRADGPWAGRQYTDVCVWDNKLWMIGGNNGPNLADIWYMKKDGSWVQFVAPPQYQGRHATGVGVYNNKLVITCGNYHNDCWVIQKVQGPILRSSKASPFVRVSRGGVVGGS